LYIGSLCADRARTQADGLGMSTVRAQQALFASDGGAKVNI
jgi:hypothetical protein